MNVAKKIMLSLLVGCVLTSSANETALRMGALAGRVRSIKKMLKRDVNVNTADAKTGLTALHYAALAARPRAVAYLIKSGADLQLKDIWGQTPYDAACEILVDLESSLRHLWMYPKLNVGRTNAKIDRLQQVLTILTNGGEGPSAAYFLEQE